MADRLLDATRAATMLAVYKYGLARYHEGYMMVGMAARYVAALILVRQCTEVDVGMRALTGSIAVIRKSYS